MHSPKAFTATSLRAISRKMGLGKALLKLNYISSVGILQWLATQGSKHLYLRKIDKAPPLDCSAGLEVHMLLNHACIHEGCWAIYTLRHFSQTPMKVIVHNDGTLNTADISLLGKLFTGSRVISRQESDNVVEKALEERNLLNCLKFRRHSVFALKLIDPFFFMNDDNFILIDSDVLFYQRPSELLEASAPVYSSDNHNAYCIDATIMAGLAGIQCIERFNPGIMRAWRSTIDLNRIEKYLRHPGFWPNGIPNYYAELTLWAMEISHGDSLPLSDAYQICTPNPEDETTVCGHYCGGGHWETLYYTRGLPYLTQKLRTTS